MSGADPPSGIQVSYRQQYRRCGRVGCSCCGADGPGHGPYWYAFWREGGRSRSRYVGKRVPAVIAPFRAQPQHAALRVRTLGGYAVWRGEVAIGAEQWSSRRACTLFKCLLSAPKHRLQREQAIEMLWPGDETAASATNLRTTIHLLRRVLGGPDTASGYLRADRDALVLAPAGDAMPADDWFDATAFQRASEVALASRDAAACRAALAWYGGDYLPDDPYEAWAAPLREALRQQYLLLLLHLAALCAAHGDLEEAVTHLRRVLSIEPGHEEAAATLMGILAAAGRRHEALLVYQALATALIEELDVVPGAEVTALRVRLLAQEMAPMAARVRVDPARPARLTNLPVALTSFVGRSWEMTCVTRALGAARLVTLTGPGGCGKTRLALQVADRLAEAYRDGAWLVELAALADPALVPRVVAGALGVDEQPGRPALETLRNFLQPRHLLLLLDNCEHLIDACAGLVANLLQTAPHLRILATSREGLAVAGEHTYLVPPLAIPDPDHLPSLEGLAAYEAVQVFLERARARRPEWTLTGENARAVAQVCAQLEGLPLAIELAAARVAALPVEGIATRLDDCLRLLTGGPRTALPRQQTLRATLDWSYELLSGYERVVQRRLAVFAGGCTLEAAEAVCSDPSPFADLTGGVATEAVLDLLAGLVAKSLVLLDDRDTPSRYRLLETVRQYGQEQLVAAGELATVRDRHLDWCIALGEQATPNFRGVEQRVWLDRLEAEHDNLRSALRWSMEATGDVAKSIALAGAIWPLWTLRGPLREGQRWLDEILARPGSVPAAGRARALYGAQSLALQMGDYARVEALAAEGMTLARQVGDSATIAGFLTNMAWGQSDIERGRAFGEEGLAQAREAKVPGAIAAALQQLGNALIRACDLAGAQVNLEGSATLYRGLGDRVGLADALTDLGQVAADLGHYERADDLHAECLSIRCSLGHQPGIAVTLICLGHVAYCRRDMVRAVVMLDESIRLSRKLGNREHLAQALVCRARVARHESDSEQATALLEEALALSREMGANLGIPAGLTELGRVAHAQGDFARAASLQRQALILAQQIHIILDVADCLETLAATLAAQHQWELAARLYGAAGAHREVSGTPMPPPDRAVYDRSIAAIRGALGEEQWVVAWAAGRATPLEVAISKALEAATVDISIQ